MAWALIPTQIYSSILDFLNCIVLCLIARRAKKEKTVAGCTCFFTDRAFYSGVFPGRPGEGKCRSDIDFTVYFYFIFAIGAVMLLIGRKQPIVQEMKDY